MQYETAVKNLYGHACCLADEDDPPFAPKEGFRRRLYAMESAGTYAPIADLCGNIIDCFEAINLSLIGARPSETPVGAKARSIDRGLLFAVGQILHRGWEHYWRWKAGRIFGAEDLDDFAQSIMHISSAWMMILHADIDSIRHELTIEGPADGYAAPPVPIGPLQP